ncbi:MAG TPA: hypothetical protein VGD81_09310 [Opitutaceae bacterium]
MKPPRVVCLWVLVIGALFLTGCASSSPESRIKRDQAAFDSYPADVQQKIRAGQVAPGFTPAQVRLALGEPARVSTVTTDRGASEVWIYSKSKPRVGLGLGFGSYGGSSAVGTGVSVGTGGGSAEVQRVTFVGGRVTAIEHAK